MSKKSITNIIIVSIAGTLLHFVYEWTGNNPIAGIFSAVNESTWEHLKLLFWPMTILSIIEYFLYYKNTTVFLLTRMCATLIGMTFIVVLFYTYTGVIGKNIDFINISLYFAAVILTFFLSNLFLKNKTFDGKRSNLIAAIIFTVFAVAFIVFTKNPPDLGIFKDPLKAKKP